MLEELTIGELLGWGSAAVVALSGVVEFSKIKINPWTWLARQSAWANLPAVLGALVPAGRAGHHGL